MEALGSPSQQSPPATGSRVWSPGQLVRVRGQRWRLDRVHAFAACQELRLSGAGRGNAGRCATLLSPFDRPSPIEAPAVHRATWPRWLRALRGLVVGTTAAGRLRAAASARIDLHAYQLEPALALLGGLATRLLLADEVGLGKTIQAGLVLSELLARDQAARTLILTPAGLRDQWADELRRRFSIDATVADAATVRRTVAQIAAGTNPWSTWPVVIASIDFVKRPEVLRALEPFAWDALLVDEAHQCGLAPERSAALRTLAARARHVILLTATPHAGDDRAFEALCEAGRLAPGDPIVMFRRSRADVGLVGARRVHLLRVRCTPAERRMHRALDRYARAVWTSDRAGPDARLAMIVLSKRALSSASSLARSLERRLDALFDVPPAGDQLALPFAGNAEPDEQTLEDDEPAGCLGAPGLEGRRERDWLLQVLTAARLAARGQSKIARLVRLLRGARQPAIVFTEYRDTARWLVTALAQTGPVALLHGGLSRIERRDVEHRFRTGAADILVATDAAAEGLNLQDRCRLVVNLELPWNPMRLEQRIGRVDRLGQARRPHAIHLVADRTAEEQIVWRLAARQERARRSIGAVNDVVGALREQDVAEAVMRRTTSSTSSGVRRPESEVRSLFTTLNLRDPAEAEARRLAFVRSLLAGPARSRVESPVLPDSPAWARLPRRRARRCRLPPGLVCVFRVRLATAWHETVHASLVALHVPGAAGKAGPGGPIEPRVIEALEQAAIARCAEQVRAAAEAHQRARAAAIARGRALAAADARPSAPVQPGMFDRRVLVDGERESVERETREMERRERLTLLEAEGALATEADLALALLVPTLSP